MLLIRERGVNFFVTASTFSSQRRLFRRDSLSLTQTLTSDLNFNRYAISLRQTGPAEVTQSFVRITTLNAI
jgi:hypothetical protein